MEFFHRYGYEIFVILQMLLMLQSKRQREVGMGKCREEEEAWKSETSLTFCVEYDTSCYWLSSLLLLNKRWKMGSTVSTHYELKEAILQDNILSMKGDILMPFIGLCCSKCPILHTHTYIHIYIYIQINKLYICFNCQSSCFTKFCFLQVCLKSSCSWFLTFTEGTLNAMQK